MQSAHAQERSRLDAGQKARQEDETRERSERLRKGLAGLWDRLRGEYSKRLKQNEMEALLALQRDREQRQTLLEAQQAERQTLQSQIQQARSRHAERLHDLHRDAANYRLMQKGEQPKALTPQERLGSLRSEAAPQFTPDVQPSQNPRQGISPAERLERLKQRTPLDKGSSRGHDLDR
jgi:seryl-tRNA synthetase